MFVDGQIPGTPAEAIRAICGDADKPAPYSRHLPAPAPRGRAPPPLELTQYPSDVEFAAGAETGSAAAAHVTQAHPSAVPSRAW
jgi:hypothetical protein